MGPLAGGLGCCPLGARRLAPAASLATAPHLGILGLVELGNRTRPRTHPAPYLRGRLKYVAAAPPCISGRTSYLQVRLAFHLYPQVIPQFCNTGGFGPRRGLTRASPCPWVAHLVSGRITATVSCARPLQTRFRSGSSALPRLNLPAPLSKKGSLLLPYTRRIILQKARRQAVHPRRNETDAALRLLVSAGVQRLFHPPPGVLFTFPSRYWFTIGGQEYPRLGGWSPQLPTGFLVPRGTQEY